MSELKNKKILCFDLDGTLAQVSKGTSDKTVQLLKKLESYGNIICIASGKPCYYLCGFVRQLELTNPIIVGENGGAFMEGIELPPKVFKIEQIDEKLIECLQKIKALIKEELPNLFYQPNEIALTPFFKNDNERLKIEDIISENKDLLEDLQIFRHIDSFDFMPPGINKFSGLKNVSEYLNIGREDFIAIGDGENDIPMFQFCSESFGVNFDKADKSFSTIEELLEFLVTRYC